MSLKYCPNPCQMFHLCTLIAIVSGLRDMVFISFLYKVDTVAKATHKQERASCMYSQKGKVPLVLMLNKMTSTH